MLLIAVRLFFIVLLCPTIYAIDYIHDQDQRRCQIFAMNRDAKAAVPFTCNINARLIDETKIDYSRTATLEERKIIYKAMMGSIIIHGSYASFFSKTSDPRYTNHLKALQLINQSALKLWKNVENNNYILSIDQICNDLRERALLTVNFVSWFYEALDALKPEITFMKKQKGFKDFYLAKHVPTTTLWPEGKQHYYFKGNYYTHQATVVEYEDAEQKSVSFLNRHRKSAISPEEKTDFMHGGGLVYILHSLEGRSAGYPLCGNREEGRGIEVIVGNDSENAAEDAKRALEWFFDYPVILTGKIRKHYLDEHSFHRVGVRAGIRGKFFNEIEVISLQLVSLTQQEKERFKYHLPDLTDFFNDEIKLKKPALVAQVPQLLNEWITMLPPETRNTPSLYSDNRDTVGSIHLN